MKLQLVFDEQPRSKMRTNAPAEMVRALNNQGLKVDILFDEAARKKVLKGVGGWVFQASLR